MRRGINENILECCFSLVILLLKNKHKIHLILTISEQCIKTFGMQGYTSVKYVRRHYKRRFTIAGCPFSQFVPILILEISITYSITTGKVKTALKKISENSTNSHSANPRFCNHCVENLKCHFQRCTLCSSL